MVDKLNLLQGQALRDLEEYLDRLLLRQRARLQALDQEPEFLRCQGACRLITALLLELRSDSKKEPEHGRAERTGY